MITLKMRIFKKFTYINKLYQNFIMTQSFYKIKTLFLILTIIFAIFMSFFIDKDILEKKELEKIEATNKDMKDKPKKMSHITGNPLNRGLM